MLKYEDIIRNLSADEKLDLIISSKRLENGEIKNYDLPKFNSLGCFEVAFKNKIKSLFPISLSWNNKLIYNIGKEIALTNHDKLINISLSDEEGIKKVSSNPYLTAKVAANLINGITKNGALASLSIIPAGVLDDAYFTYNIEPYEMVLKESTPFLVETRCENIGALNKVLKYKGNFIYNHFEEKGIQIALNNEALFATSSNKESIRKAIDLYKEYYKLLENGEITKTEFNKLEYDGTIFNEGKLDSAVDRILETLAVYDEISQTPNKDDIDLSTLYDESVLMLKNDDVLPLKGEDVVQIVGSVFERDFINELPNFSISTSNYTRGYFDGVDSKELQKDVIKALSLNDSNILLLGIKIEDKIDDDILNLIKVVKDNNLNEKKIILCAIKDSVLDVDFSNYADAIIQIPNMNKEYAISLLKVLKGEVSPSARTPFENEIYPLGFGLGYGAFKYSKFKIRNLVASVVVENDSAYGAYDVLEVYSKTPFEDDVRLCAYKKVYLHPFETKLFEIPLSQNAFSVYSTEHESFMIKEGVYEISIRQNKRDIIDTCTLEMKEYIASSKMANIADEAIVDSKKETLEFLNNNDLYKKYYTSFKKKFAIISIISLYFLALFIGIIVYDIVRDSFSFNIKTYTLIGLCVFCIVLYIILIIKSALNSPKTTKKENTSLESILRESIDFDTELSFKFNHPILEINSDNPEEDALEEENADDTLEETKEEEEIEPEVIDLNTTVIEAEDDEEYDDSYVARDIVYEEVSSYERISLDDLTVKFNMYALEAGYVLELSEIRVLLAAVLSTKLLFIEANNFEYLKGVLTLLNRFFGSDANIFKISDDVYKMKDLLWKPEGGVYTYSDFTVDILKAKSNPRGLELMVVDNVDMNTFPRYFYKFIKKTQAPKLPLYLKLERNYEIPSNICYIVIPKGEYRSLISPALMDKALFLNLNIGVSTLKDIVINPVSYEELVNDLKEASEEYFLNEDDWKKLDELEDEMKKRDRLYTHTNIGALLIDSFATALYTLDNERYVLDDVLACYYVPLLKCSSLYKRKNGYYEIRNILIQIFDEANIPLALKALNADNIAILNKDEDRGEENN